MLVEMLLYGALIPGAAAGLVALLLSPVAEAELPRLQPGAAAVGFGFMTAFAAYFGVEDLLEPQSWHWVFWGGTAGAAAGLLRGRAASPPALAILTALAGALLLKPMLAKLVPHELDAAQVLSWCAGIAAGIGLLVALLEIAARAFAARALAPSWVLYTAGCAGLMFQLGSARLSQISGFVAAGCGALAVLAWALPARASLRGAAAPVALVLGFSGANAYFFGYDVPWPPLALAALPPILLSAATRWAWLRGLKPLPAAAILVVLVAVPLAAAFLISLAGTGEEGPYGEPALPY